MLRYAVAAAEPAGPSTTYASSSFTRYRNGLSPLSSPDAFFPLTRPQMVSTDCPSVFFRTARFISPNSAEAGFSNFAAIVAFALTRTGSDVPAGGPVRVARRSPRPWSALRSLRRHEWPCRGPRRVTAFPPSRSRVSLWPAWNWRGARLALVLPAHFRPTCRNRRTRSLPSMPPCSYATVTDSYSRPGSRPARQ